MKIAALLLTAVVVLNSFDISSQGNSSGKRSGQPSRTPSQTPSRTPSPPRREPSPPRPMYPFLPPGSLIIRNFEFPSYIYCKVGRNNFEELPLLYDAVLNYERKIVAIFLKTNDNVIFGLYDGRRRTRVKLNPACIRKGQEHVEQLDNVDEHYYPEFESFEKPNEIMVASRRAYKILGRGLGCSHTAEMRESFLELPQHAHIVRGVEFPPGFFFKITKYDDHYLPIAPHICDVVVDPFGMIVAVFLGPSEYILRGIYIGEGGDRLKLTRPTLEAEHVPITHKEATDLYIEFLVYQKPSEIYRDSFAACG